MEAAFTSKSLKLYSLWMSLQVYLIVFSTVILFISVSCKSIYKRNLTFLEVNNFLTLTYKVNFAIVNVLTSAPFDFLEV
jgi:hypothetical protein